MSEFVWIRSKSPVRNPKSPGIWLVVAKLTRQWCSRVGQVIVLICLMTLITAINPVASYAQSEVCEPTAYSGMWRNIRSEVKILAQLEVKDTCNAVEPYGFLKVRATEKCYPRNCSWGWERGIIDDTGHAMTAEFRTFIAKRFVRAVKHGNRLRVIVETDYISPERKDTTVAHIFVRSR